MADTFIVPQVESWANAPSYDDLSSLDYKDKRCYKERLVPDVDGDEDADSEEVFL